ncbi:cellulase [Acetobacter suratthaniensis]|uniref:Cellulase n=1 Tax=Acetobacter suratthaniensis TaxID=1502841 RepID=A0ABS3LLF0_9PROT|nr:glycoside hydrolase family 44 protein [Acetobacter suratthaniensis]MBO1328192.1 cellulase [Acetobacter suratthaniensis]
MSVARYGLAGSIACGLVAPCGVGHAQTAPASVEEITVDGATRHPISPLVYGVNFASTETLKDLRVPINRSGGDSASTYNWRVDARNAGKDWYYESVACDPKVSHDQFGPHFISMTRKGGATPMPSLSMLGWQAKLAPDRSRLASFAITKYGPQQDNDADGLFDAGNGYKPDGTPITDNDPHDAQTPSDVQSEQDRLRHVLKEFGSGALPYVILDNEPSLWQLIHRDVHPVGAHADEIAKKVIDYSAAVKAVSPTTKVVAPEEWGWQGYHYSGFDQQYAIKNGLDHAPDRENITGGMDYVPWLLTQWKAAGHPVDVFSLHFYPQEGEYSDSDKPEVQLARNRSTRDLWDPTYKDPSWINSVVALVPLMRQWVDQYYYPGTPIALTEYSWGGDKQMNGATAQADVLGILGREGMDIATHWGDLDPDMPVYKAIKLYRNYDSHGGAFGDVSLLTHAPNPDEVSAFAAQRSKDDATTVVVINKRLDAPATAKISLANLPDHGRVESWLLADNTLTRKPDTQYSKGVLDVTLPQQSVLMLVLRRNSSKKAGGKRS